MQCEVDQNNYFDSIWYLISSLILLFIHKPMHFYTLFEDLHYSPHYLNVLNNEFELR